MTRAGSQRVVRPAASENHRNPVMVSHLSGGDPEGAAEGIWPSGYKSKAGRSSWLRWTARARAWRWSSALASLAVPQRPCSQGPGFTAVAVDRTPNALDELPEGIRREVGDTTDQALAKTFIATLQDLRVMVDVSPGAALWLSQAVEP